MIKLDIILLVLFLNIILFNLKSCKFRIKINQRDFNQKSEIVCVRVKGSKVTTDTLFSEIEKVLLKEGVLDK